MFTSIVGGEKKRDRGVPQAHLEKAFRTGGLTPNVRRRRR